MMWNRTIVAMMLAAATLLGSGCADSASAVGVVEAVEPTSCQPVRVAIVLDKSMSMVGARTVEVSMEDLQPALDLLAACGGDLAVGTIHDKSRAPFARVRIEPAPDAPLEPVWSTNGFEKRIQRRDFDAARTTHETALEAWRTRMTARIERFAEQAQPLVEGPADAMRSPVWDAVRRADAVLSEPNVALASASLWIIAVTDGIEDAGGRQIELRSGARLLVVNGVGTANSLASLEPTVFDSFASSLGFVIATEGFDAGPE